MRIENIKSDLLKEKQSLLSAIANNISVITVPPVQQESTSDENSLAPKIGMGAIAGGLVLLVWGINQESTTLSILGGVVGTVGAYSLLQAQKTSIEINDTTNYTEQVSKVFNTLNEVYKDISEKWYDFVGRANQQFQTIIKELDITDEDKSRLIQKVMTRTVVEMPMNQILLSLNESAKQKDLNAINVTINNFKKDLSRAVEK